VVGDLELEEAKQWIDSHFGNIPAAELPAQPDISEARQEKEKFFVKDDSLANKPAMAVAYHMPQRNTPEYYAMGLLDQILVQGDNGLLVQKLKNDEGYTANVSGGINYLGNMFNYKGPMLWMFDFTHDKETSNEELLASIDQVMDSLQHNVSQEMIDQALVKLRSGLYDNIGGTFGLGRADLLCSFALFDDDPGRINSLEEEFRKITPAQLRHTIEEYLRNTNRTILSVNPLLAENPKS
jgi:predicted Zn-dependent peptidase